MDEIGKLDRVADEEDRLIYSDQIPVPPVGVELYGEPPWVARGLGRATEVHHGGEPHEHRRLLPRGAEERGPRGFREIGTGDEDALSPDAAGMNDPFRNSFAI